MLRCVSSMLFLYNILKPLTYHTHFLPLTVATLPVFEQVRFFGKNCTCRPQNYYDCGTLCTSKKQWSGCNGAQGS